MADDLRQLRLLCALHWNPIGFPMANVAKIEDLGFRPLPEDEYDSYLTQLVEMVKVGASRIEMLAYLTAAEEYIGVSEPAGSKEAFLDAVLQLLTPN